RIASLRDEVTAGTARWKKEQDAALAVIARRKELAEAKGGPAQAEARKKLDEALEVLEGARQNPPLIPLEVTPEVVASVIADWTGIPIGSMIKDEAATLLS